MKVECSSLSWRKVLGVLTVLATAVGITVYRIPHTLYSTSKSGSYWKDQVKNRTTTGPESAKYGIPEEEHTGCTKAIGGNFRKTHFDINGSDVMVFLHMQKTGGTEFGRKLVANIQLAKECEIIPGKKKRNCLRPNSDVESWLFSRFSTGWVCGLHADWTELQECVAEKMNEREGITKDRKFFYVTYLRHPIKRFLSEWKHVRRGATWKNAQYSCNREPHRIPQCYEGRDWTGVPLENFMSCNYNMAVNRQTRMLADLRLTNCYQRWLDKNVTESQIKEIEDKMLESAKKNLMEMSFFGILEEQRSSQKLFEYIFPFKFKEDFVQYNTTLISDFVPTREQMDEMIRLNHLDLKLYDFAITLFDRRYKTLQDCFG